MQLPTLIHSLLMVQFSHASFTVLSNASAIPSTLSKPCVQALTSGINCDAYLKSLTYFDYYGPIGDNALQDKVCSGTCGDALAAYTDDVSSKCRLTERTAVLPAYINANKAWLMYNQTCLKEANGSKYCTDFLTSLNSANSSGGNYLTNTPKAVLCSSCVLNFFRTIQQSVWSLYDNNTAVGWAQIQAACNVSDPTAPLPQPWFLDPFSNATSPAPTPKCASGNYHVVKANDTCVSIAKLYSVATGALELINNMLPSCANLNPGRQLCLPLECRTHTVQTSDTCWSLANTYNTTASFLISYNPTVNSWCSNLKVGETICVSQCSPQYVPIVMSNSSVADGVYASTTVAPPGPTPSGTTPNCGEYYKVSAGDYCQLIAMKNTMTVQLFEEINPAVNPGCTNLQIGKFYCISPTWNWNQTQSSPGANSTVSISSVGTVR